MDGDTGGDIDGGGAGCADGMTMPCASANAAGLGEALDWPARRGAAGSTGAAFWPDAAALTAAAAASGLGGPPFAAFGAGAPARTDGSSDFMTSTT
jgi:hypothetical protein